jgi:beta-glucosidase
MKKDLVEKTIEQRVEELLGQLTLAEKVSLLSGKDNWRTVPIPRLGIPSLVMTDGPHGVRTGTNAGERTIGAATSFPTGIALGATWDTDLIEKVGVALAEETRALNCDILLAPCVNIVRSPLGGRNFETYAEDPYLAGKMATAYIRGVQSQKIGTSLKHFACNNQEFERNRGSSEIDERTLREIYLAQFEMAVKEAKPWTVMCSYNRLNGTYASENYYLLTQVLREEWGFEGAVVSDWGANHSVVDSVEAGLDLEMPGPAKYYGRLLEEAVINWQIEEETVNQAVRRILRLVLLSGKMDAQPDLPPGSLNTPAHQKLARKVAAESMVLLKNESGLLPLHANQLKTLAVIGPCAAETPVSGGGSACLEPPYKVSPLDGIKSLVSDQVRVLYTRGCDNRVSPPIVPPAFLPGGVQMEIFDNPQWHGEPVSQRVEEKISFFTGAPLAEKVNATSFSVRLRAKLQAPVSGKYMLILANTDHARLSLDGKLLIDNQPARIPHAEMYANNLLVSQQVEVELDANKPSVLTIEYTKTSGERQNLLRLFYQDPPEQTDPVAEAVEMARGADAVVLCAGMPFGFETEGKDRPHMHLTGRQDELIEAVAAVNPNTVVVLHAGSPVAMPWIGKVKAVLLAHYFGMEGGNALASILFGEVNPCGKLTETFPQQLADNPAFLNYPGDRTVNYGEGIFVGYRYYDHTGVKPLFPFGHGLSYTTFKYKRFEMSKSIKKGQDVKIRLEVKNTGSMAGHEIVQLYVSDLKSSLIRPPKELKGFKKINLDPGETKAVSFTLNDRSFSFYDPHRGAWVMEPGDFEILVGSSSTDIRLKGILTYAK